MAFICEEQSTFGYFNDDVNGFLFRESIFLLPAEMKALVMMM